MQTIMFMFWGHTAIRCRD